MNEYDYMIIQSNNLNTKKKEERKNNRKQKTYKNIIKKE